jgi:hypothetical protein
LIGKVLDKIIFEKPETLNYVKLNARILKLDWNIHRTKVPGGWFVLVIHNTAGFTFYPDPEHKWDGGSLT